MYPYRFWMKQKACVIFRFPFHMGIDFNFLGIICFGTSQRPIILRCRIMDRFWEKYLFGSSRRLVWIFCTKCFPHFGHHVLQLLFRIIFYSVEYHIRDPFHTKKLPFHSANEMTCIFWHPGNNVEGSCFITIRIFPKRKFSAFSKLISVLHRNRGECCGRVC